MRVSGVVLAGGASTRMGRDKALIVLDGERLVDRAVRLLSTVADDVVVASGRRVIGGLSVAQIPDQRHDAGPLSGLASALLHAEHDLLCVLAVDLVEADPTLFSELAGMWRGEGAIIPSADGRPQPLHAVWSAATAGQLSALMADGVRSVQRAAAMVQARVLSDAETLALIGHDRWAVNLNTPADLPG